uniref:Uncharacterized protein n=1 Tax=Leuconostoc citreum TaxID=33964 RepID=A0A098DN51_LEUCI|nr:Protein of unknown function [Leuconostoc citreum]
MTFAIKRYLDDLNDR